MNIKTQTIVSQTDLDAAGKVWGFGAAQAFVEFGAEDGKGNRVFDTAIWNRIQHGYKGKAPAAAPMAVPPFNGIRIRTAEEKAALLEKFCKVCPSFKEPNCTAAKCCGGKLPVATVVNLTSTQCPLGKF